MFPIDPYEMARLARMKQQTPAPVVNAPAPSVPAQQLSAPAVQPPSAMQPATPAEGQLTNLLQSRPNYEDYAPHGLKKLGLILESALTGGVAAPLMYRGLSRMDYNQATKDWQNKVGDVEGLEGIEKERIGRGEKLTADELAKQKEAREGKSAEARSAYELSQAETNKSAKTESERHHKELEESNKEKQKLEEERITNLQHHWATVDNQTKGNIKNKLLERLVNATDPNEIRSVNAQLSMIRNEEMRSSEAKEKGIVAGGGGPAPIIAEGAGGHTVLVDPRRSTVKPLGTDINKPGTANKEDTRVTKELEPVTMARDYVKTYIGGGKFTGAGDDALRDRYFDVAKPSTGFRMTEPVIRRLLASVSWAEQAKAKVNHATEGPWMSDEQRKQLVGAINQLADSKEKAIKGVKRTDFSQFKPVN